MPVLTRRDFVHRSLVAAAAVLPASRSLLAAAEPAHPFPLVDYHVHLSDRLSLDQAVELARARGLQFGIVDHPGRNVGGFRQIETDDDLQEYIRSLRSHPVYVGLQPVYPGWSKPFAQATLDQLDYVLMDALTMPDDQGGWRYLWAADTFIDDEEAFMERYTAFIQQLLTTERIDIFGWPTYLPVGIAREYDRLWTTARQEALVELARKQNVAIEINEVARVPSPHFVALAKEAGLKFTFGTDARNQNAGRFSYCLRVAEACGLTSDDMFTVRRPA